MRKRTRSALTVAGVAIAVLAAAPVAGAATITYARAGGGTVVYTAGAGETLDTTVSYESGCVSGYSCVVFHGDGTPTLADSTAGTSCASETAGMSCVLDNDHSGLRIVGGAGNDSVTFYESDIGGFPAGTPYHLVAEGNGGNDALIGGDGDETLDGGPGADRVTGRGGSDAIDGGDGNDTLSGDADDQYSDLAGGGGDVVRGGAGDDHLVGDGSAQNASVGHDVLDGGPGIDTATSGWYRFDGHGGDEDPPPTITLDGIADDGRPGENDDVVGIEHVSTGYQPATSSPGAYAGSDGSDEINLLFANGTVSGNGGDDRITGSDGGDALDGGAGNDEISGGFGDDVITGGPGRDSLGGDRTAACFYGPIYGACTLGSGNDTIYAQDGERDTVDCGPGADAAWVDAVDVTTSCETLHVTGATTGAGGGRKAPPVLAKPSLAVGHQRLRTIAKRRAIRLRCRLKRAGRCSVRARIRAKDGRGLHLKVAKHARWFTLGSRAVRLKRAGTATVVIRIRHATAVRLRRARSLRVTLTATARYATGRKTSTRRVRIRR